MSYDFETACARMRALDDEQARYALEMAEAKAQIVAAANAAIDEIIRASGLTYGEILGQAVELSGDGPTYGKPVKSASKRSGNGGEHPRYAMIGDPSCTYARGPVPLWMKREMETAGMDPTSKADRETFRQTRMVQV